MKTINHRISGCLVIMLTFGLACTENTTKTSGPVDTDQVFACRYENPFSQVNECRQFYGGWDSTAAGTACSTVFTGVSGVLTAEPCTEAGAIGTCTTDADDAGRFFRIWFYGGAGDVTGRLCGDFLNGTWEELWSEEPPMSAVLAPLDDALDLLVSTPEVTVTPDCQDGTCFDALLETVDGIEFRPAELDPTIGFILYPGAQVDPRAYSPIADGMARLGLLTVIVPMPGYFALNGWDRAQAIMERRPEIQSWYLGGHSMGGAMSAHFAKENPDVMDGIILWAAYAGAEDDLSGSEERVMSIYGDLDGVATVEEIERGKPLLPADTQYVEIRGGNHAQFGRYGAQEGDNGADLPAAVQYQQVIGASVHFVRTGEMMEPPAPNTAFAQAPGSAWCGDAQRIVAALDTPIDEPGLTVEGHAQVSEFITSTATWAPSAPSPLQVSAYVREQGNPGRLDAPPLLAREIWCKLKSQALLVEEMNAQAQGEPGQCGDVNRAAVDWALQQLTEEDRARLDGQSLEFVFDDDEEFPAEQAWIDEGTVQVATDTSASGVQVSIRSAAMKVGDQNTEANAGLEDAQRNVVYCKLLAPAEALRIVMDLSDRSL